MDNQTISYVAYGLALVLGLICFLLVKHTADEFDRWYEMPSAPIRAVRLPLAVISLIAAVGILIFVR